MGLRLLGAIVVAIGTFIGFIADGEQIKKMCNKETEEKDEEAK